MSSGADSKRDVAATDDRVGSVLLDRYRIVQLLGVGGRGKVYAGEHLLMKKKVAVKFLHPELSSVPEFMARFEREAVAAANIDHPNVAAATDFGKLPDGSMFLVLEFVEGKHLRDEIAGGPLPVERALRITRQIATALGSAHALGIVHRDLKPENVMLVVRDNDQDFVKVLDFGLANAPLGGATAQPVPPLTKAGMVFGTPEYMAPEQALGLKVDGRADLFALGVITFEMLSGVRPFSSESDVAILGQQLSKPAPSISERAPGVRLPPRVEQVVAKMLAKDAPERYQTAGELVQALDELLGPRPDAIATAPASTGGPKTAILGSLAQVYGAGGAPAVARPASPAPVARSPEAPSAATRTSVELAAAKESFTADEPLPAFTYPALDERTKQELLRSVERAREKSTLGPLPPPAMPPANLRRRNGLAKLLSELGRIGRDAWTRGSALARQWIESACTFIDRNRSRLPVRLREPLRQVRSGVILAVLAALAFSVLLGFLLLIGGGSAERQAPRRELSAPTPLPAPKEDPVPREIEEAKKQGHAALEKLAERHSSDHRVWLELAASSSAKADHAGAVRAVSKALAADPKASEQPRASELLALAVRRRETSDAAFLLLEGPMGSAGATALYDLSIDPNVRLPLRARAEEWVRSEAFKKVAAPDAEIAASLKYAKSCSDRHALLPHAAEKGGRRVLDYLNIAKTRGGCGRGGRQDCFPCLRKDDALKDAIATLEKRLVVN